MIPAALPQAAPIYGDKMQHIKKVKKHIPIKSKLIENTVNRFDALDSYHVEEDEDMTQHWISASDGYLFPEYETSTVCGFDIREMNEVIKNTVLKSEFYRC